MRKNFNIYNLDKFTSGSYPHEEIMDDASVNPEYAFYGDKYRKNQWLIFASAMCYLTNSSTGNRIANRMILAANKLGMGWEKTDESGKGDVLDKLNNYFEIKTSVIRGRINKRKTNFVQIRNNEDILGYYIFVIEGYEKKTYILLPYSIYLKSR